MSKKLALTGDQVAAEAMRQINPDVVAAYPITPQTEIVMTFSKFVSDGLVDTEIIPVESEHSAMSAVIGASAAGARVMTATSSQGLALMWEVCYIAASYRLPIVMAVVNRALSGPINIHCDHSDTMGARDSGWIQIYCENAQEVYESMIMAVKIAEQEDVMLPVMVNQDGFITSHEMTGVDILDDKVVKEFIGEYKPKNSLLNIEKPVTYGPLDLQDFYFEHKRQQAEAMKKSRQAINRVFKEFSKITGKEYKFIEPYKLEDAEVAVVVLSSTAGTSRIVVDELRKEGVKAGLLKIRVFRPFPGEEIVNLLSNLKAVAVMDRSESFADSGGPVFNEIKSAFYDSEKKPLITNFIYGLGGRDVNKNHIRSVYNSLIEISKKGKVENKVNYLGVRE